MRKLLLFWTIGAQVITWGGQAHGPSSRDVKPSAMGTQRLVGTLFDTRHTSATLRLLNKGPREVDVRLQAYSRSGRREDMTTATIMGNDITMIDLNAGFPEVGWLELEYEGKPLELGGQIIHRSRKGGRAKAV